MQVGLTMPLLFSQLAEHREFGETIRAGARNPLIYFFRLGWPSVVMFGSANANAGP